MHHSIFPQIRQAGLALLLLLFIGLFGCGSSGPPTHPVTGKVVFKGKGAISLLNGGQVICELVSDPKVAGLGEIDDEGAFALGCVIDEKPYPGLLEGTYRARIVEPDRGGEESGEEDEGRPRRKLVKKRFIHQRFENYNTSKLQFTVKPGSNEIVLEVER